MIWTEYTVFNRGILNVFIITPGLQIQMHNGKLFFLFLYQNICCGYAKKPSQRDGSFEHPKHMFKLMGKKMMRILRS